MKYKDIVVFKEKADGKYQKYLIRLPINRSIDDSRVTEELHFDNGLKVRISRPKDIEITEKIKERILSELEIRERFGIIDSSIAIPLPEQVKNGIVEEISESAQDHTIGSYLRFLVFAINGTNQIGKPAETINEFLQNLSAGIQAAIENALHRAFKKFNPT